jgi:ornithine carbamoyltransferase
MSRHFLRIPDFPSTRIYELLERARTMKKGRERSEILRNACMVLLFEKASTRTRISFEVAIRELGGSTIFMTPAESQLGRSEPLKDTIRVLERYAQGLVARTYSHESLEEMARYCGVPLINALSDMYHPCQVMSDLLSVYELTPDFSRLKIAWIGDGNNMAHSWINAASCLPFRLHLAVPRGYEPDPAVIAEARRAGADIELGHDPREAASGAHYINTDVWTSMGQESTRTERMNHFREYQVDPDLVALAGPEAKVMHCLPAHRGEEIAEEVLEGPQSIVWDQAENRLHMQKALLEWIAAG